MSHPLAGVPRRRPDLDELPPGTHLCGGTFQLQHRLGRGSAATVYLARQVEVGARVALKVLESEKATDANEVARFQQEVRVGKLVGGHPNIVEPLDSGVIPELDDRPYLTVEYVEGQALDTLLLGGRLDPLRAAKIVLGVAKGTEHLHRQGVIHRDIKAANVIVERSENEEHARLLDFGLSFVMSDQALDQASRLTLVVERPGTKHYMAPEQAIGLQPAPSYDVYALAVVLYETLTGHVPGHGLSPVEVVQRKVDSSRPSFSIRDEPWEVPDSLAEVVDAGLKRDPADRISSVSEFIARLDSAISSLEARDLATALPEAAVSETQRPASWKISVVAFLMAVLGCSVLLALWSPEKPVTESSQLTKAAVVGSPPPVEASAPTVSAKVPSAKVLEPPGLPKQEPAAETSTPATGPQTAPEPAPTPATETPAPRAKPSSAPKSATPKRRKKPSAAAQKPQMQPCEDEPAKAKAAVDSASWKQLVAATRRSECWESQARRVALRVRALYELGRYDDCIKAGRGAGRSAKRLVRLCERRLEEAR